MNKLTTLLRDRIAEQGALSVSDYMEACLSHPEHGYYMQANPFGRAGDFVTSPEISQIFGELIGLWCADIWMQMCAHHGGSLPIALAEIGPGRGTLMKDALRATQQFAGFHESLSIHMIESSPRLANEQYHTLRALHPRIEWLDDVTQLPQKPTILIANEFFDALPIKQFIKTANGLEERLVDWDTEKESFTYASKAAGLSLAKGDDGLNEGQIIESCPAARTVMNGISAHIAEHGGAALIIDYGYQGIDNAPAKGDSLQAVKAHQFVSVLNNPGEADLTAHVDFGALSEAAQSAGLITYGSETQGMFLTRLGAEIRAQKLLKVASEAQRSDIISGLQRIIAPEQMGNLFKVLGVVADARIVPSGFVA